ncbi:MAG: TetR/AcrR family transcriptional regulator [Propionibacteriaceae bacterium]
MTPQTGTTPRSTYRHGDLRRALVEAARAAARRGGPDAVVLREVTRSVGVAPNAAYRHFRDRYALLSAVADSAMSSLAATMEEELQASAEGLPLAERGRASLRAVGRGYLAFAVREPGLFRTAFSVHDDLQRADDSAAAGPTGRTPFQLLGAALDLMVDGGVLPDSRRPGAEFLAWSAVHGLAVLLIDGPLRSLDADVRQQTANRLLLMVEHGL